jgi:hypothetical protein
MQETPPVLFSKKDDSFDPSRTGNYDLLVRLDEWTFSYSVRDSVTGRFIVLESLKQNLEEILVQLPLLRQPFRSARILVENNKFTLVPVLLYEESEKENLLDFSVDRDNREIILADRLIHPELYNLYAVPGKMSEGIAHAFPQAKICHLSTALIESLWIGYKNQLSGRKVFIHVRERNFDLLVFDGIQLHYCNAFPFAMPEDLAYYVIFVMEQLDLNPEETGAVLMGDVERRSPVFELLFRYIRHVEFAPGVEPGTRSAVFHDLPGHVYYLLLNPFLCGS